jgi:hypothetical protein
MSCCCCCCCCIWPSSELALPDVDMSGGMSLLLLRIMMLVLARWREEAMHGLGRWFECRTRRCWFFGLPQGRWQRRDAVLRKVILQWCLQQSRVQYTSVLQRRTLKELAASKCLAYAQCEARLPARCSAYHCYSPQTLDGSLPMSSPMGAANPIASQCLVGEQKQAKEGRRSLRA